MSTVERLEAAIAKLEVLREAARGGPWSAWHSEDPRGNSAVDAPTHDEDNPWLVVEGEAPDVDLIVTLHRTIEPQLAILRLGIRFAGISPNKYTDVAVVLTDAILGRP